MKAPGSDEGRFATVEALAGVAREVEGLRTAVDGVASTPGRVEELAKLIAGLAETVNTLAAKPGATPPPSWLNAPADPAWARRALDELTGWMRQIYLRYSDAGQSLPDCWCLHADVVEELLWLMHAWLAAFQGKNASVQLVGDWHDRQRPGVVRRIRTYAGTCSPEAHLIREGWRRVITETPTVPGQDSLDAVADWWGRHRDQPAPEPAGAHRAGFGGALNGNGGAQ